VRFSPFFVSITNELLDELQVYKSALCKSAFSCPNIESPIHVLMTIFVVKFL